MSQKMVCNYCNHKFTPDRWDFHNQHKCPKCNDTNLTEVNEAKGDIYGYNFKPEEAE